MNVNLTRDDKIAKFDAEFRSGRKIYITKHGKNFAEISKILVTCRSENNFAVKIIMEI